VRLFDVALTSAKVLDVSKVGGSTTISNFASPHWESSVLTWSGAWGPGAMPRRPSWHPRSFHIESGNGETPEGAGPRWQESSMESHRWREGSATEAQRWQQRVSQVGAWDKGRYHQIAHVDAGVCDKEQTVAAGLPKLCVNRCAP
jgi:hypothetical protein